MSDNISPQQVLSKYITPTGIEEDIYFEIKNNGVLNIHHKPKTKLKFNSLELFKEDNSLIYKGAHGATYVLMLEDRDNIQMIIPLRKISNGKVGNKGHKLQLNQKDYDIILDFARHLKLL
jgi:hypothetical protein